MSTFVYCTEKLFCIILFGSNSFNMLTYEKVVQAAIVHLQWRIQEFDMCLNVFIGHYVTL